MKQELSKPNARLAALEARPIIIIVDADAQQRLTHVESWIDPGNPDGLFKSINQQLNKHANLLNIQERRNRENNLLISGLHVSGTKIKEELNDFLLSRFRLKDQIVDAKIISKFESKPVIVMKLLSRESRMSILKIKRENFFEKHIFINPDLTPDDARLHKKLRTKAREARDDGKTARVRNGKIQIENIWYTLNEQTGHIHGRPSGETQEGMSKNFWTVSFLLERPWIGKPNKCRGWWSETF